MTKPLPPTPPLNLFRQSIFHLENQDADGFVESLKSIARTVEDKSHSNESIVLALRLFFSFSLATSEKSDQFLVKVVDLLQKSSYSFLKDESLIMACRFAMASSPQTLLDFCASYPGVQDEKFALMVGGALVSRWDIDWFEHKQTLLDILNTFPQAAQSEALIEIFTESLYLENNLLVQVLAEKGLLTSAQCFWSVCLSLSRPEPDRATVRALSEAADITLTKILDAAILEKRKRPLDMQECSLWGFECAVQYKLRPTSVNVDAARGLAEAILKFVAISDPKRSVIEKQHDWLIKAVLATGRPLASTERNGFCFEELKEVFNKILLTRSVEDFSQLAPSKKRSLF